MFVISVKTGVRQILAALGCVAVLAVAMVTAALVPNSAVTASAPASNRAERVAYLRERGCEVEESGEEVREIRIPDEPDAIVKQYSEQAGISLEPYYGKRLRVYSYKTTNEATAQLYVYRDRVIAGCIDKDGSIQPLQ